MVLFGQQESTTLAISICGPPTFKDLVAGAHISTVN